jgi:16S rRNA G966 N2-methylase RsmD
VPKALSILKDEYGLVLLDPPYEDPSLLPTLEKLTSSALVGASSTVVIEHSRRTPLPSSFSDFALVKEIRHGDTCVSVYQSKSRRLES